MTLSKLINCFYACQCFILGVRAIHHACTQHTPEAYLGQCNVELMMRQLTVLFKMLNGKQVIFSQQAGNILTATKQVMGNYQL